MDKKQQEERICNVIGNSLYFAHESLVPLEECKLLVIIADSIEEAREIARTQFNGYPFTIYKADATNNCRAWEV